MDSDTFYTYGYTTDYYGYGPMALIGYYGSYYAWAYGDFVGGEFTYNYGLNDYYYNYGGMYPGYYYTSYWYGWAAVK